MSQSNATDQFNKYLELPDDELEWEFNVPESLNSYFEISEDELFWELDADCSPLPETDEDRHP